MAAAWRSRLRGPATVHTREQLLDEGWFGAGAARGGAAHRRPRRDDRAVVRRRALGLMRPEIVRLLGLHGSTSEAELAVPVIVVPPRRGA